MDAALGWIGDIVRWVLLVFPRLTLVRMTHRGIKFVRENAIEIGPGLHVWWPVTTEVETVPVVRQVIALAQQIIRTKDGKTVIADGVLVYSVGNVMVYLTENWDADQNIAEIAQAALRSAILSLTLEEIDSGRVKLDNKLTREATGLLQPFGVSTEALKLVSCAEGQVMIHAGTAVSVQIQKAAA